MLIWLGHRRLHLHNFAIFLGAVVALAAGITAVFVATARREDQPPS